MVQNLRFTLYDNYSYFPSTSLRKAYFGAKGTLYHVGQFYGDKMVLRVKLSCLSLMAKESSEA